MIKQEMKAIFKEYPLFNKKKRPTIKREEVIKLTNDIRSIIIPGFYRSEKTYEEIYDFTKYIFIKVYQYSQEDVDIDNLVNKFFSELPKITRALISDVEAFWNGDPAAKSKEEIIISYPGFYAILIYRIAHILYTMNVPFLPRIMSEIAHSATGIDINPGASIGNSFFIDHGTGIVIGETVIIGDNVKIYQGVTLGALSIKNGHSLEGIKRHPTIEDNVTIYSGASILGGDVIISHDTVVGGNTFITESIPPHSLVKAIKCDIEIIDKKR